MSIGIHFGIDTSNYTTSAAAISDAGEVFYAKRLLSVPQGNRGMRQSDALFCHTRDLAEVCRECLEKVKASKGEFHLRSVGVSRTPRRREGSYMPCFLAGVNAASVAASLSGVELFEFSHQEGHLEAARQGALSLGYGALGSRFLAFHLSGGTCELVLAEEDEAGYRTEIVAETLDLTCGQLIDRCGVALGLSFPSGKELEALAQQSTKRCRIRIPTRGKGINLSGFENRFTAAIGVSEPCDIAAFVFDVVEAACRAMLEIAGEEELPVLFSGGVSSSVILRERFSGERYHFAPADYAADNAIGIAYLARKGAKDE